MTAQLPVVLTPTDFALLEDFTRTWGEPFPGSAEIIRRKLAEATLVLPTDLSADVVTLNSRVRFRVGSATADERSLVGGPSEEIYGLTIPLGSPRGLALIGAAAGQTIRARRRDGWIEEIFIEAVPYQPEQRRFQDALKVAASRSHRSSHEPSSQRRAFSSEMDNDPGPSVEQ